MEKSFHIYSYVQVQEKLNFTLPLKPKKIYLECVSGAILLGGGILSILAGLWESQRSESMYAGKEILKKIAITNISLPFKVSVFVLTLLGGLVLLKAYSAQKHWNQKIERKFLRVCEETIPKWLEKSQFFIIINFPNHKQTFLFTKDFTRGIGWITKDTSTDRIQALINSKEESGSEFILTARSITIEELIDCRNKKTEK